MEQLHNQIEKLSADIASLHQRIDEYETARQLDNWLPRKQVMKLFDYEETQIAALLKNKKLKVAQIGNRKFISKDSILKLLEESIKQ